MDGVRAKLYSGARDKANLAVIIPPKCKRKSGITSRTMNIEGGGSDPPGKEERKTDPLLSEPVY